MSCGCSNRVIIGAMSESQVNVAVELTAASSAIDITPAYAAGDALCAVQTLDCVVDTNIRTARLTDILITEYKASGSHQKPALELLFFGKSGVTATKNSAFTFNDSVVDTYKFLGSVTIATADYVTVGDVAYIRKSGLDMPVRNEDATPDTTVYVLPVITAGTPDFDTGAVMRMKFTFVQN